MSDEGFFRRWSRLKSSGVQAVPVEAPRAPAPPVPVPAAPALPEAEAEAERRAPLPTLEDAARLTPDADFSAFVAHGVDKSVQRLALKKLFSDPHFNAIDGLDMYMDDYNKAAPLAPGMLASLKHAPGLLSRLLDDQQKAADAAAQVRGHEHGHEHEHEHEHEHGHEYEPAPPSTQQGNA